MMLRHNRSTGPLNPKVETKDGVVTLNGKAGNAAEFNLASRLADDVNGVKGVINWMTFE